MSMEAAPFLSSERLGASPMITTLVALIATLMIVANATLARKTDTKLFGGKTAKEVCPLPVEESKMASDEEIIAEINKAARTKFDLSSHVLDCLKVFQNNAHHLEGWLYNHVILMLYALRWYGNHLSDEDYMKVEQAILYSDLGKKTTTEHSYKKKKGEFVLDEDGNKIPMKVWDDGTPQSSALKHDIVSAQMYADMEGETDDEVLFLIKMHMQAHDLAMHIKNGLQFKGTQFTKKIKEFRNLPECLTHLKYTPAHEWPLEVTEATDSQEINKQTYRLVRMWRSELLKVKQACDAAGRISDLDF